MKYQFLSNKFNNGEKCSLEDNELLEEFKESLRSKFFITAISLIVFYYVAIISTLASDTSQNQIYTYVCSGGLFCGMVILLFYLKYRKSRKHHIYFKWSFFIVIYAIQTYYSIWVTLYYQASVKSVRNLYLLYILSGLFLVMFLQFSTVFIIIISTINLLITVFDQIYFSVYLKTSNSFALEFTIICIITIGCLVVRSQYESMIRQMSRYIGMNHRFMSYIDNLLDNQPSAFITLQGQNIVYMNKSAQEFLRKNLIKESDEKLYTHLGKINK